MAKQKNASKQKKAPAAAAEKIPDGYRLNHLGHLVPEFAVEDYDKARDRVVLDLVAQALQARSMLAELKEDLFAAIERFMDEAAAEYGTKLGGKKGNVTLTSFDGRYQIKVQVSPRITFDERLQVAKSLIDECLVEWAEEGRVEIRALIQDAFQADQEGRVQPRRILSLRKHNFRDKRWQRAMKAINDSISVVDSKTYIRFYERDATGSYQPLSLDIAAL